MTGQWWTNDEHELYWVPVGGEPKEVYPVESFTVKFGDGTARALLVVRMPNIEAVEGFGNGDHLVVVHVPCGPRGRWDGSDGDVRLKLCRCAVLDKGLDSLFTNDPTKVAVVGAWLKVRGTMKLFPDGNCD
jgi:hypothetical protein